MNSRLCIIGLFIIFLLNTIAALHAADKQEKIALKCDFEKFRANTSPSGWHLWKKQNKGKGSIDGAVGYKSSKSLKVTGVESAAYQYCINVLPGEVYELQSLCLKSGSTQTSMAIYWRGKNLKWNWKAGTLKGIYEPFDDKWQKTVIKATVPVKGVKQLGVILLVWGQGAKDAAWFDNIILKRLKAGTVSRPVEKKNVKGVIYKSGFESVKNSGMPEKWALWRKSGKGKGGVDNTVGYKSSKSLKICGAESSAFQYFIDVKPGDIYEVESICRKSGLSKPLLAIYWKDKNLKWNWKAGKIIKRYKPFDGEWERAVVRVTVPYKEVKQLVVNLLAAKQQPGDSVWFDNVVVRKLKRTPYKHYKKRHEFIPYPAYKMSPKDFPLFKSRRQARNCFRMGILKYGEITKAEAEKRVREMRDVGYDVVLTEGQRYLMNDDRDHKKFPDVLVGSLPFKDNVRYTKIVVDACHKYGLKVYLHLTASASASEYAAKHPEHMTRSLFTGKTKVVWDLYWICLNNKEFRKEYFKRLETLVEKTGADGLMVDETNTMYDNCGCPQCRALFKKDTGHAMPANASAWLGKLDSPVYRDFLKWRMKNYINFNLKIKEILKKHTKDGTFLSYYAIPGHGKSLADHGILFDNLHLFNDCIGWEILQQDLESYWPLAVANMKLVRAVAELNEGNVWLVLSGHTFDRLYLDWLFSLAESADKYWVITIPRKLRKDRTAFIQWEALMEKYLAGTSAYNDTAVLFSSINNNMIVPTGKIKRENTYAAIASTLSVAGIPFKTVVDKDIDDMARLGKLKILIIPNIGMMSEKKAENIRNFVKAGGTLIASAETSLYDENCQKRNNFALADVFGCDYKGMLKFNSNIQINKKSALLGDITGTLENPDVSIKVSPRASAKVLATLQAGSPALVVNNYGKGKVVYLATHPESSIYLGKYKANKVLLRKQDRDVKTAEFLSNIVKNAGKHSIKAENLPPGVLLEVYNHEYNGAKGIQIHLLNLTNKVTLKRVLPGIKKIRFPKMSNKKPLKFIVRDKTVKRAFTYSPDFEGFYEVKLTKTKDGVVCELPTFRHYQVIYLDKGGNDAVVLKKGKPVYKKVERVLPPLEGSPNDKVTILFLDSPEVSGGGIYPGWRDVFSRIVYNKKYGKSTIKANMTLDKVPENPILEIGGLDDVREEHTRMILKINGKTVFDGKTPFRSDKYSAGNFSIPKGLLKKGKNEIILDNPETWSDRWGQPFYAVYYLKIREK